MRLLLDAFNDNNPNHMRVKSGLELSCESAHSLC